MTAPAFGGEVSEYYQRFRRGYPPEVADALAAAFGADARRRRARPRLRHRPAHPGPGAAGRGGARHGPGTGDARPGPPGDGRAERQLAAGRGLRRRRAVVGFRPGRLAAVTVAQALHWMDHERLFAAARPLLRPGGGVAVVTNGEPLWLQDTAWSAALREVLSSYLGTPLHRTCGTDEASQSRYADALSAAGYAVDLRVVEYATTLTVEEIVGGVFSAMSPEQLPDADARPAFTERVREAVTPHGPLREHVVVRILTGTR